MRIIHVLHSHGYGGAENHALTLMQGQRDAGHEVLYAGPLDSWLGRACAEAGIPAEHIGMHGLFDPLSHWKLRRLVRRWGADIVHGHLVRGAMYAGLAGRLDGAPLAVCTAHATTARTHMRRCARIIAVSQAVVDNLLRAGYEAPRIRVVHNGVPDGPGDGSAAQRAALRAELGIPDGVTAVVNAGRFIRDKGQDLLLQAMPRLPAEVHLYLMGSPDTDFGRQVLAMPHDPQRVHFLGYRPDVQRVLPAFDIFALPSRREALPLSVVEAFAARLPVVAAAVGGVPEIVLHGRTGLQVPPDNLEALERAITRVCQDRDLAERLKRGARQHFERHLIAGRMVARTLEVYESALRAAAAPPNDTDGAIDEPAPGGV